MPPAEQHQIVELVCNHTAGEAFDELQAQFSNLSAAIHKRRDKIALWSIVERYRKAPDY
jgi:hypothetical protein